MPGTSSPPKACEKKKNLLRPTCWQFNLWSISGLLCKSAERLSHFLAALAHAGDLQRLIIGRTMPCARASSRLTTKRLRAARFPEQDIDIFAARPKNFEVLRYLVENPDRLVTKEELLKAIWPDVVVTEASLTRCVSEVRQAIGDSKQTIIVTVPRCGYRFTAAVSQIMATNAMAPQPAPPTPESPWLVGASGLYNIPVF
jgi:DNA-binding winged helix-turn-helix (wHTH) protein